MVVVGDGDCGSGGGGCGICGGCGCAVSSSDNAGGACGSGLQSCGDSCGSDDGESSSISTRTLHQNAVREKYCTRKSLVG